MQKTLVGPPLQLIPRHSYSSHLSKPLHVPLGHRTFTHRGIFKYLEILSLHTLAYKNVGFLLPHQNKDAPNIPLDIVDSPIFAEINVISSVFYKHIKTTRKLISLFLAVQTQTFSSLVPSASTTNSFLLS